MKQEHASSHTRKSTEAKRPKTIGPQSGHGKHASTRRIVNGQGYQAGGRSAVLDALGAPGRALVRGVHKTFKHRKAGLLPPQVRRVLEKQGETVITSLRATRTPLDMVTNAALNVVTLGAFDKAVKKSGYDKAFHLALVINEKFVVDKQEVIKLSRSIPRGKTTESKTIPVTKSGVTIGQLLEGARKVMGDKKFTGYNAKSNNCQDFIIALLEGSGLMPADQDTRDFIKQDATAIFKKLPKGTAGIAKKVTDFAAGLNKAVFGQGKSKLDRLKPEGSFGEKEIIRGPSASARPIGLPVPASLSMN